ncbi:MAG TPA: zinc ribbon domain-containing protein [Candidatus Bathyarchaeia archaeon]|nr:zinc ribbon domain-containing protein [Candidatus Bathyarchaeia archaeon]
MENSDNQPEVSTENSVDPHCAACNMTMHSAEDHGTDSEGNRSEEYCCHCMQGGTLM